MTTIHRTAAIRSDRVAPGAARIPQAAQIAAMTAVPAVALTLAVSALSDGLALALSGAFAVALFVLMFIATLDGEGKFSRAVSTGPLATSIALLSVYSSAIVLGLLFLVTL